MAEVNEEIARLFFEDLGFFVRTNIPYRITGGKGGVGNSDIDLLAINSAAPKMNEISEFILTPELIQQIPAASIEVKGWHNHSFSQSVINEFPRIFHFTRREAVETAASVVGNHNFKKILVLSRLPKTTQKRAQSIEILRAGGIDHVVEFRVIMEHLSTLAVRNKHYASEVMQTLRLVATYIP